MIPKPMRFEGRNAGRRGRTLIVSLLVLAALGLSVGCSGPRWAGPPTVILIVVDTLRADHLSQYGYERSTSPALAQFSAQSTLFSAAYSTSSWTQPSVASLFTGLLPARHGVVRQSTILPAELDTLAGLLAEGGWQTVGFSGNLFIGAKTGFDRGFEHFEGHEGKVLAYPDAGEMLDRLSSWLEARRNRGKPTFLYFQPMNCHGPYRVPAERRSDLLARDPTGVFDYNDELMTAILKDGDIDARQRVTPEYLTSLTDQYDTAVRYSMEVVGALLKRLRQEGLYQDSLIIVTSDHGEELFDHGGFGHGYSLFEEVVRVPLWIKVPRQREGAKVELPVSLVDLLPTILEVVGVERLASDLNLDGRSLAPLLTGATQAPGFRARPIVMDTRWKSRAVASAIRRGSYKLIEVESDYQGRSNVRLLFDLASDPVERVDLSAREPDKVAALSSALDRVLELRPRGPEAQSATDLDVDVLRALGYMD